MEAIFESQQISWVALLAVSAVLGAVIGAEREFAGKPAGLRTHIIVCIAATLLMFLGNAVVDSFQEAESHEVLNVDPVRVIQAIVIGISFLGAGTIVHQGPQRVEGLTTAASILLTAGIGIAVGTDQYIIAVGTTILAVTVLWVVGYVERAIDERRAHPSVEEKSAKQPSPT